MMVKVGASEVVSTNEGFTPPPLTKVEETGLSMLWLQDLALKIMYYQGYLSGHKVAEELALPFLGVVDAILEAVQAFSSGAPQADDFTLVAVRRLADGG